MLKRSIVRAADTIAWGTLISLLYSLLTAMVVAEKTVEIGTRAKRSHQYALHKSKAVVRYGLLTALVLAKAGHAHASVWMNQKGQATLSLAKHHGQKSKQLAMRHAHKSKTLVMLHMQKGKALAMRHMQKGKVLSQQAAAAFKGKKQRTVEIALTHARRAGVITRDHVTRAHAHARSALHATHQGTKTMQHKLKVLHPYATVRTATVGVLVLLLVLANHQLQSTDRILGNVSSMVAVEESASSSSAGSTESGEQARVVVTMLDQGSQKVNVSSLTKTEKPTNSSVIRAVLKFLGTGKDGQVLTMQNGTPTWKNVTVRESLRAAAPTPPPSLSQRRQISQGANSGGESGGNRSGGGGNSTVVVSASTSTHNHENAAGGGQLNVNGATNGVLAASRGGTSFDTYSTGDLLIGDGTNGLSKLLIGADGQILSVSGSTAQWISLSAASGISQTNADARYLRKSGGTVTGALVIDLTSGTLGLRVIETASGNILHAEKDLTSSGTLTVVGTARFKAGVHTVGTVSGASLTAMNGNSYILGNLGIGKTGTPNTKLEVVGTISGSLMTISGLRNCDTIDTDANGVLICGADGGGGGGMSVTDGDLRYVRKAGSTMTGALIIDLTSGTLGLRVIETASGNILHAEKDLTSSGTLTVVGTARFKGNVNTVGTLSGGIVTIMHGNSYILGNVGIGKSGTPNTKLEVVGTMSGSALTVSSLRGCDTIDTSANGVLTCGTDAGATTDADLRYVRKSGSTMTGALIIDLTSGTLGLRVIETASGNILHAEKDLTSSGTLTVVGTARFKGNVNAVGTLSGGIVTIMHGNSYILGNVGIGKSTTPNSKLEVVGTMSGTVVLASAQLRSSGALSVQGTARFKGNVNTVGTISGAIVTVMHGNSYILGNVGIGKSTTPNSKLEVVGTVSGSIVLASTQLRSSGSLTTDGTARFKGNVNTVGTVSGAIVTIMHGNSYVLGNLGIGKTGTPNTKLEVVGTISGSLMTISGLRGCDTIDTSANGILTCGTDAGANSVTLTDADLRYLRKSGGTMTGALVIDLTSGTLGLRVIETASGNILHAEKDLTSSGTLTVVGTARFKGNVNTVGTISGAIVTIMHGNSYILGNVGIGKSGTPNTKLEVVGTMSGSALTVSSLRGCDTIDTDSNGVLACGIDSGAGGGLSIPEGDLRYLKRQGGSMTGGLIITLGNPAATIDTGLLLEVAGTASGRVLHAQTLLRSSGALIVSGAVTLQSTLVLSGNATFDTTTLFVDAASDEVGIGTITPKAKLDVIGTISGSSLTVTGLKSCNTIDTDVNGVLSCGTDASGASAPTVKDVNDTTTESLTTTNTVILDDGATQYLAITPSSSSNEILVMANIRVDSDATDTEVDAFEVRRTIDGTAPSCTSTLVGTAFEVETTNIDDDWYASASFVDSPGVSTEVRYTVCGIVTAATAGSNDTNQITFVLMEVNRGADLAEVYDTNDETITMGDVVSIDPSLYAGVQKSRHARDSFLIGIVSSRPSLVIGHDDRLGSAKTAVPIAVAGRVPVKVNTENGPIQTGDFLTSSSVPGVAMKAIQPGIVIGQAISGFDGMGIGVVLVYVKNTMITDPAFFASTASGSNSMTLVSGDGTALPPIQTGSVITTNILTHAETFSVQRDLSVGGALTLSGALNAQNIFAGNAQIRGNADIAGLLSASAIHVSNSLSMSGAVTIGGSLTLGSDLIFPNNATLRISDLIATNSLFVLGDITIDGLAIFLGDVQIKGRLTVSNNQAGFAVIPAGSTHVNVNFPMAFGMQPIVTASSQDFITAPWRIRMDGATGFTIELASSMDTGVTFAWFAIAADNPITTTASVSPNTLIDFPVDANGVPLSSESAWNACIRNHPLFDSDGQPLSCSRYHEGFQWVQPDLLITFTWNTHTVPPLLILPDGYRINVVADQASSSSSSMEQSSSISSIESSSDAVSSDASASSASAISSESSMASSEASSEQSSADSSADISSVQEASSEESSAIGSPEASSEAVSEAPPSI
jgi:hypothetical protein